jgi:2-succinyl-6-hydroxy-2,4-cyclohexadiene-1-carboxylate synthase
MRILALHGQMGMMSDWDTHAKSFAACGHQLESVDLWRYLEGGEIGPKVFAKRFNEDHEDGEVLLGYSMGGRLALQVLIDEPQKWKAAVIISAHVGLPWEERRARREADNEWARNMENSPWSEFLDDWNTQGVLGNNVMPDRTTLKSRIAEIARSFRCWSLAEQEDLLEELAHIKIPVLWVVGENDEKFCIQAERAASRLKDVKIIKIPNSGHRVPWEAEAELVGAITDFMSDRL